MNGLMLDTHALLWFVFDDSRLSETAASAIADPAVDKIVSVASLWEIAIKLSLGKLQLGTSLAQFFASEVDGRELDVLGITNAHLVRVADLPIHHRDPFDRLLIAQALVEGLPIATMDLRFATYGVDVRW
jgi:PIN domain nuclease of toxin-antitoxin system